MITETDIKFFRELIRYGELWNKTEVVAGLQGVEDRLLDHMKLAEMLQREGYWTTIGKRNGKVVLRVEISEE